MNNKKSKSPNQTIQGHSVTSNSNSNPNPNFVCPNCGQKFLHKNQTHSCNDKTLNDYLRGKSDHVIELFWHFINEYKKIGDFDIRPTKTMIGLVVDVRFAFVMRLGKNFVDVMFPFDQAYKDNECFYRIGSVPGVEQYNHYCRLMNKEDVNDELRKYMKKAWKAGKRS